MIRLKHFTNEPDADYKFEIPEDPAPPAVDDEIRRKEEEELQRVIEMSMQDRVDHDILNGLGRSTVLSPASSQAGTSSRPTSGSSASPAAAASNSTVPASHPFAHPKYQGGGYVPARTPSKSPAATPQ